MGNGWLRKPLEAVIRYDAVRIECDGPAEVRKAARRQLANGADFLKLLVTEAITSTKYEKADAIQLRPDEIVAAVELQKTIAISRRMPMRWTASAMP